jgi:predicted metalloprotease
MYMFTLHQTSAHAAWDLHHAGAVEDLIRAYFLTLPMAKSVEPPRLFIYQGKAFSRACPESGIESPAYCPGDHTVYLETGLGDEVAAKYGDFGALSIIAHEFGHAYLTKLGRHPKGKEGELAADRFAGGFARYLSRKGLLEQGDIDEARATFAAVGDHEVYSHDHHGTPAERSSAFEDGYLHGFRLPGDYGASQPQAPAQPTAEQSQPLPPAAAPTAPQSQALPLLGLGFAALLAVVILAGVISLIGRARDDDF